MVELKNLTNVDSMSKEYITNGDKFDSIEIRKELEDVNFNLAATVTFYFCALIAINIVGIFPMIMGVAFSLVSLYYFFKFAVNFANLDFLFLGSFIRFGIAVAEKLSNQK